MMKYTIRLLVLVCFIWILPLCCQTGTDSKQARMSTLMQRIENGDNNAILELGSLGDRSAIPYLQKLLTSQKHFGSASSNAQMALAKLGEKTQFAEILNELKSDDPAVQDNAVKKLTYVGGYESIRALINLLDDSAWREMKGFDPNRRGPKGEAPQGDVAFLPLGYMAMLALSQIAPNPPVPAGTAPKAEHIPLWRKWWADVGSKLEKTQR